MDSILLGSLGALLLILLTVVGISKPAINAVKTSKHYQIAFSVIAVAFSLASIYYLWYILIDLSKAFFQLPVPIILLATIYACYDAYKGRVNEPSNASSFAENVQDIEETSDSKSSVE
jgi:Ca2+/Na+ antiporter